MPYRNDTPPADRPYLSIAEASRWFGINHKTIRRAIDAGSIPDTCWVQWGDTYRINRPALEQHLADTGRITTKPAA